jgi:hypothetical protein
MRLSWFGKVSRGSKELITSRFPFGALGATKWVTFKHNVSDTLLNSRLFGKFGSGKPTWKHVKKVGLLLVLKVLAANQLNE